MTAKPAHVVNITHPDKVLFPEDGITKGELIEYYQRISRWMLPFLEDRPLALQRFPDGIGHPGFFQKAAAPYYPEWIDKVTVEKAGGTVKHVVCNNAETLAYLANQACITPHIWLSRVDRLRFPDQMIFDLDPSTEDAQAVIDAAQTLKELLDDMALPSFIKTTGSRGVHVGVPLDRKEDFDSVRECARQLAQIVVDRNPDRYTLEQYKEKRRGRVFIDINRNAYAQTAAPPYAVRARKGAPVSVPIEWTELDAPKFRPDGVTIRNVFERLETIKDPWKDFWRRASSLDKARRKMEKRNAPPRPRKVSGKA